MAKNLFTLAITAIATTTTCAFNFAGGRSQAEEVSHVAKKSVAENALVACLDACDAETNAGTKVYTSKTTTFDCATSPITAQILKKYCRHVDVAFKEAVENYGVPMNQVMQTWPQNNEMIKTKFEELAPPNLGGSENDVKAAIKAIIGEDATDANVGSFRRQQAITKFIGKLAM